MFDFDAGPVTITLPPAVSSVTAKRGQDGSVAIQFGNCDGLLPNCLPVTNGWNYTVRLFRPRPEVLDGTWKFPTLIECPVHDVRDSSRCDVDQQ